LVSFQKTEAKHQKAIWKRDKDEEGETKEGDTEAFFFDHFRTLSSRYYTSRATQTTSQRCARIEKRRKERERERTREEEGEGKDGFYVQLRQLHAVRLAVRCLL